MEYTRGDHGPDRDKKTLPIGWVGPGLNSDQNFVPKARYFGTKLVGFSAKNGPGLKILPKNGSSQNDPL